MVFPPSLLQRIKYFLWRLYTPIHPHVRDSLTALGVMSSSAKARRWGMRQPFLLGTIAPHETPRTVVEHLAKQGFGNHFVAWEDDGEVVSLRYAENFEYQYHVRIFKDGEVRAHYEYTPECHPIKHYYRRGCFEPRREEFLRMLGSTIVPAA